MEYKEVGALLRSLRIKHGYKQAELAELLHVTHQAVSRWEKGTNMPNLLSLIGLKKLYHISIDELLLEVEPKIDRTKQDYVPKWYFRFFLLPVLLMGLSFGLALFYFHLNMLLPTIMIAILFGLVLSVMMVVIKVRNRGYSFLITLGILLFLNGTIYLSNKHYFDLMEVPYFVETDQYTTNIPPSNLPQISLRYQIDDQAFVMMVSIGEANIQLYDINAELSSMVTYVNTMNLPVMSITILGNNAYFTTYERGSGGSSLHELDLVTKEIRLLVSTNQRFNVVASKAALYLIELDDLILDHQEIIYMWDGQDILWVTELHVEIVDIIYHEGFEDFFVSITRNVDPNPYNFGNIFIYDDQFVKQAQVFERDMQEYFTLKRINNHVYTSLDNEIIRLLFNQVTYTGVQGGEYLIHDIGTIYLLGGQIVDSNLNIIAQNTYYTPDYRPENAIFVFSREDTRSAIAIQSNVITLLKSYSRQVEVLTFPSYWRHVIFAISIPFIALVMTFGTTITYKPKKLDNSAANTSIE